MSDAVSTSKELTFALDLIHQAGRIALEYFRKGVKAELKGDNTPVTAADRECEALIREAISRQYPDDALLGEEQGESTPAKSSSRKWIIDPIDGTYNFARGIPIWSLLLALEEDARIKLGIVHAPAMSEIFYAERGGGAFRNGERVRVSGVSKVSESFFLFGGPRRIAAGPLMDGLKRVMQATSNQRAFGDYLNFAYVFAGKAEATIETGVKPWDLAPMKIIAEEAGGRYTDLEGGDSIYKGSCLVSNGLVHDEILKLLL